MCYQGKAGVRWEKMVCQRTPRWAVSTEQPAASCAALPLSDAAWGPALLQHWYSSLQLLHFEVLRHRCNPPSLLCECWPGEHYLSFAKCSHFFFSAVVVFLQLEVTTEQLELPALIQHAQQPPLPSGGWRVSDGTRMVSAWITHCLCNQHSHNLNLSKRI